MNKRRTPFFSRSSAGPTNRTCVGRRVPSIRRSPASRASVARTHARIRPACLPFRSLFDCCCCPCVRSLTSWGRTAPPRDRRASTDSLSSAGRACCEHSLSTARRQRHRPAASTNQTPTLTNGDGDNGSAQLWSI